MIDAPDHPTRRRVLVAAVGLFADQGFAATSVRQVCAVADANIAAVNYHFGSKSDLYDAAIDFARAESTARNRWVALDPERNFWSGTEPAERLRRFVGMMIDHALDDDGRASELSRIMMHEMLDPTPAFERQIEVSIARVFEALRAICRDLIGPEADEATVTRLAVSINGQCMYPALAARCLTRLHPGTRFDRAGRDAYSAVIVEGMLAAISAAKPPAAKPGRPRVSRPPRA